jgi:hypothetical protein
VAILPFYRRCNDASAAHNKKYQTNLDFDNPLRIKGLRGNYDARQTLGGRIGWRPETCPAIAESSSENRHRLLDRLMKIPADRRREVQSRTISIRIVCYNRIATELPL